MKLKDLDKDEKSLLLFLETAVTDRAGIYKPEYVNDADREKMHEWAESGFITKGRVASAHLRDGMTVWVQLSGEAMRIAHEARTERARRMWKNRKWKTTDEYCNE